MSYDQNHITALHHCYIAESRQAVVLRMDRIYAWEAWLARGWDIPELLIVIRHIKRQIKQHRRFEASLKFSNLIHNLDRFEEDLSEARAEARKPVRTERDRVLESTGRIAQAKAVEKTAGQILASANAFEAFRQWRKETGI